MKYDLLITNCAILPIPGESRVITDGFVAIRHDKIVMVDRMTALPPQSTTTQAIDTRGCLVMPGLINAHCHAAMTLFRGLADDIPLMTWLNNYIFPAEARLVTPEMVYWCSKLAAAEMLLSGTTTVADGYFFTREAARAFEESGLRAVCAQGIIDFPTPDTPDPKKNLLHAAEFLDNFQADNLITPALFRHSPYTCSPETLTGAKKLSNLHGCKLFIHVAETVHEYAEILQKHQASPVKHLANLGILDTETVCIHCVHMDRHDINIIKNSGCSVVSCPESNMKLAAGVAPVPEMLKAGIPVALGTDSCASNNDLDLMQEMDTLAKLHKTTNHDPSVLPASKALSIATTGGATALGFGTSLGRLEVGMLADLIIIDLNRPHLTPFYNTDLLVYAAKGADVTSAIIAGKLVMHEGKLTTMDLNETMTNVRRLCKLSLINYP